MFKTGLRCGLTAVLLALSLAAAPAFAEGTAWPQRPVKFILPLGTGAGVDIVSRVLGDRLSQKWGQSVIIDNKPGGDGVLAITTVLSAHDSHTLLMAPTSTFTHHPWALEKMPYDPRDLIPVARTTNTVIGLMVPASSSIKTAKELFAAARANPGKLNQANATGVLDIVFRGFQAKHGLVLEPVPYRNTVQAVNDLAEGRIQVYLSAVAVAQPLLQANKVRIIAVTASQRAPAVPDVPTIAEAGYPDLTIDGLVGLFCTRELPQATRERIAADIHEALVDPTINARLVATGQTVNFGGPAEFAAAMDKQRAQAAEAAKLLGLKPAM